MVQLPQGGFEVVYEAGFGSFNETLYVEGRLRSNWHRMTSACFFSLISIQKNVHGFRF